MTSASPSPTAGLELRPFRALRYNTAAVPDISRVLSPPYDVIDPPLLDELERRSPYNVVRLILPRERPDGDPAYAEAARRLREWRDDDVLTRDPDPALYVYEESSSDHVQRGLVGAVGLVDPDAGVILPHENTMAGPVADRLELTRHTHANLEPIMLVYDGQGAASRAVATADQRPPLIDTTTADGLRHRVWALTDPDVTAAVGDDLWTRRAVIADGHHRYATYLRYQAEMRESGAGAGPWDYGLALVVDVSSFGPQVHAIHRVVGGITLAEAEERARAAFRTQRLDSGLAGAYERLAKAEDSAFVITDGDTHWLLDRPDAGRLDAAMPAERSPAWRALGVSVAHHLLITALWGLTDTEDAVGYRHDVHSAIAGARETGGIALLLRPTSAAAVAAVAANGERMPRKSTLFTPKPATGLLIRDLRDS